MDDLDRSGTVLVPGVAVEPSDALRATRLQMDDDPLTSKGAGLVGYQEAAVTASSESVIAGATPGRPTGENDC